MVSLRLVTILIALVLITGGVLASNNLVFGLEKKHDVIIIGAGMSGLAAGNALDHLGYDVLILEARDRIGGRIWTDNSTGLPLDLGASWTHGVKYNPLWYLTQNFGVEFVQTLSPSHVNYYVIYDEHGKVDEERKDDIELTYHAFKKELTKFHYVPNNDFMEEFIDPIFEYDKNKHLSVEDVLKDFAKDDDSTYELLSYYSNFEIEHEWASDISDISVRHMWMGLEYTGPEIVFPQGYGQLIDGLSKKLEIKKEHVVTKIEYDKTGVRVFTENKQEPFQAQYAISTIPLGVLKDGSLVEFSPPLPEQKLQAIDNIGMGVMNKVYLVFDETDFFWKEDKQYQWISHMAENKGEWSLFLNFYPFLEKPVLLAFNSGQYGKEVESLTAEEKVEEAMAVLKKIYGDQVPDAPLAYKTTDWYSDPFARGSYSFTKVGSTPTDFDIFAEPIGDNSFPTNPRVFFAGEATIKDYYGTVHGAYISGVRAAEKLNDHEYWLRESLPFTQMMLVAGIVMVPMWTYGIRWRRKRQSVLDATGRSKEVSGWITVLTIVTLVWLIVFYSWYELNVGIFNFEDYMTTLGWDEKCYNLNELLHGLEYLELTNEQEAILRTNIQECYE